MYIICIYSSDMVVRSIGNSLMVILPDLVGKKITNWFDLVRPLIAFKFQTVKKNYLNTYYTNKIFILLMNKSQILNRTNNIFELVTVEPVPDQPNNDSTKNEIFLNEETDNDEEKNLRLKGIKMH